MILEYIYHRKELLYLLISQKNKIGFWEKINQKIMYLFKIKTLQNYQLPKHMDENEFNDMILFYSAGFYAIYKKWLFHNCCEDIDTVAERITLYPQAAFDHILIKKGEGWEDDERRN